MDRIRNTGFNYGMYILLTLKMITNILYLEMKNLLNGVIDVADGVDVEVVETEVAWQ